MGASTRLAIPKDCKKRRALQHADNQKARHRIKAEKRNEIKRHIIQIAPSFLSQKKGEW